MFCADNGGRIKFANVHHLHVSLIVDIRCCVVYIVRMEIETRVVLLKQDVFGGDSFAEMREGTPVAITVVLLVIAGCGAGIRGHLGATIKSCRVTIVTVHYLHDRQSVQTR